MRTQVRAAVSLVASALFLAPCLYYDIEIPRHLAWIALDLGFYSAIQVANNTFLGVWLLFGSRTIASPPAIGDLQSKWRAERRSILKQYLSGLRQDFWCLERLARLIAAFSREIRKRQEWEWVWLALRFHFSHRMVALKLAIGSSPSPMRTDAGS